MLVVVGFAAMGVAYLLRGVLFPLFFAFLVAYALDPFVDRLEEMKVPRTAGAFLVMVGILAGLVTLVIYAIPLFVDEVRSAAADLALAGAEASRRAPSPGSGRPSRSSYRTRSAISCARWRTRCKASSRAR